MLHDSQIENVVAELRFSKNFLERFLKQEETVEDVSSSILIYNQAKQNSIDLGKRLGIMEIEVLGKGLEDLNYLKVVNDEIKRKSFLIPITLIVLLILVLYALHFKIIYILMIIITALSLYYEIKHNWLQEHPYPEITNSIRNIDTLINILVRLQQNDGPLVT